jgi:hypothetical protein
MLFLFLRDSPHGSGIERVIEIPSLQQNPAHVVAAPMPTIR